MTIPTDDYEFEFAFAFDSDTWRPAIPQMEVLRYVGPLLNDHVHATHKGMVTLSVWNPDTPDHVITMKFRKKETPTT